MSAALLPVGLAFIMFSLGLGLRLEDFRRVLHNPLAIATGLLAQIVLLPVTGLVLARVFALDPTASVGLMILAASPGGVTAGIVTRLALGDTALSITLTAFTSLLAFLSVPIVVGGSIGYFMGAEQTVSLPLGPAIGGLFVVTLLPVILGLWLHERHRLGKTVRATIHRLATAVFVAIVVYTFIDQWSALMHHLPTLGPAVLSLNVVTMITGWLLAGAVGLAPRGRVAMAMECGIQNSALGIALAVSLLGAAELAVPSLMYALLMNLTALLVIGGRRAAAAAA